MYDKAYAANPKNEEMASHLFMALVRQKEYKRQQQIAMSMFKTFNNAPYFFWAVTSLVMQARVARATGMGRLADAMFLPLAEKMLVKARADKLIYGPETIRLYLMVLDLQNKHTELLALLQDDADLKFREDSPLIPEDLERDRIKVKSLLALEQWSETATLYKEMIETNVEELSTYFGYFDVLAKLQSGGGGGGGGGDGGDSKSSGDGEAAAAAPGGNGGGGTSYSGCVEFLDGLIEKAGGGSLARTPLLARVELAARKEKLTGTAEDPAKICELLLACTAVLGSKICCFSDVKTYLPLLGAATPTFVAGVQAQLDGATEEPRPKQIRRHIFTAEAAFFFANGNTDAAVEDTLAVVNELLTRYAETLPAGTDLKETELQHADPYGLLAAQYLVGLHKKTSDAVYIRRAAVVLEKLLVPSKYNAQARLLLVKLYCLLGASDPAWPHWKECGVKQVQLDSIGHIMADHAPTLCGLTQAQTIYGKSRVFFSHTNKEMPEFIINAYKHGSFHKIQEFTEFQQKIKWSLQAATTDVEVVHMQMKEDPQEMYVPLDISEIVADEDLDNLSDNRDFDVMDSWYPSTASATDGTLASEQRAARVAWLKYRCLQIRVLNAMGHEDAKAFRELSAKLTAAYDAGVESAAAAIAKPADVTKCFKDGIHLPRRSQFAALATVGVREKCLVDAAGVSCAVNELMATPKRGEQLATSGEDAEAACSRIVAELEGMLATCAAMWGDKFKTLKGITQTEVEAAAIAVEVFLHTFFGLQFAVHGLYPKRDPQRKESKPVRQQREMLLAVLKPAGERVNALLLDMIALLAVGEAEDGECADIDIGDAVLIDAADGEAASTLAAALNKSHTETLSEFARQLTQMTIKFVA